MPDINDITAEPDDPLFTDRESARFLGCAVPTFHRWVRLKKVPPPVKLGSLSRWPRSELSALIENAKAARYAA